MIFVEIITNHPEVQIYLGVFCEILRDIFIFLRDFKDISPTFNVISLMSMNNLSVHLDCLFAEEDVLGGKCQDTNHGKEETNEDLLDKCLVVVNIRLFCL